MSILILAESYPTKTSPYAMAYVHSRSLEYKDRKIDFSVLSFNSRKSYEYEGVKVLCQRDVKISEYSVIVSHAPNLKNHARLIYGVTGKKLVFFFHGHEVLHTYGDYPDAYPWQKSGQSLARRSYDKFKMPCVRWLLRHLSKRNSITTIFVSDWMRQRFIENIDIDPMELGPSYIIPNTANRVFFQKNYCQEEKLEADFVTIRPLDASKYAIDLVVESAKNNPERTYHIYGRGDFFLHVEKPANIKVMPTYIQQNEIPGILNSYRAAILPSRYDAQGVLACEIATYGMPIISSDIEICREMLGGMPNVRLLHNDNFGSAILSEDALPSAASTSIRRFHPDNIIDKEIEVLHGR